MSAHAHDASVRLLGRMLAGLTATAPDDDPEAPDLSGTIEPLGERGVTAKLALASGDTFRLTVEWLPEESP